MDQRQAHREAHELVTSVPTYAKWTNGQACSVCGALVPMNPAEREKHTRWHAALAVLHGPRSEDIIGG